MGTLSGGNGGGWPPDELPDLPPEWGRIVIPDDASELAQEAAKVRRELRAEARARRLKRRLHLPRTDLRPGESDAPPLGVPLLVILIATIATLTSLFVISWPTPPQRPQLQPTAVSTPSADAPSGTAPANQSVPNGGAGTPASGPATPQGLDLGHAAQVEPVSAAT
ncbi:hypothetical protein [Planosporangium mesophilum]|uniref:Uncharacterized protein n=1 Tax=Planosporangium mesophilum TaxID=689768 RepID=A0A8J3TFG6_9ACTN|nr:hypothetical protein [Planosporangium mesophilum]NJC83650.1 hypothetical protein [Planosporangium mesophilum]GII25314.1 hypothetical protein Pme01_49110 [Planosporangium mesophilum]